MDFLNTLLAGLVNNFKAKNPTIFWITVTALVVVYVGLEMLTSNGVLEPNNLVVQVIQYIDIAFLTVFGMKTTPFLKEYLDQVGVQQTEPDNWWTQLIDGFKLKSPMAFGIIATTLISVFVGIHYAIDFGVIPEGGTATFLRIVSYVDMAVLILLGTRTGQYIIDNPPSQEDISPQAATKAVLYYD